MTNRERVQKALEEAKKTAAKGKKIAPKPDTPKPLAKGEKPTKRQRSAEARDARMPSRGRLPNGSRFDSVVFDNVRSVWTGEMWVPTGVTDNGYEYKDFHHTAAGLFQLLEELDCQYWEWVAAQKAGAK